MNRTQEIAVKISLISGAIYLLRRAIGMSAGQVSDVVKNTAEFVHGADRTLTLMMDGVAQNFQGNDEAIETFHSKGITGKKYFDLLEVYRSGKAPFLRYMFNPELKPALYFTGLARDLNGDTKWAVFQNWLTAQSNIYLTHYKMLDK